MISFHGYQLWRHKLQAVKPIFTEKYMFFFKVKLVDKMKQSTYLRVILHVKRKKGTNSRRFYPISNNW